MLLQILPPGRTPGLEIPRLGAGRVVSAGDASLQRAAEFIASLLAMRGRERRAVKRGQAVATLEAAKGKPYEELTAAEHRAAETVLGRPLEPGEVPGGAAAEAAEKLSRAQLALFEDPDLGPKILAATAIRSVSGEWASPEASVAGIRADEALTNWQAGRLDTAIAYYNALSPEERGAVDFAQFSRLMPGQASGIEATGRLNTLVANAGASLMLDPDSHPIVADIERATGQSFGDVIGAVALGLQGILTAGDDLDEAINTAAQQIGVALRLDPAQIKRVWNARRQGRAVPRGLEHVAQVLDVSGATILQDDINSMINQNPAIQLQGRVLQMMNQIDPHHPLFRRWATQFMNQLKVSLLELDPAYAQLGSEDPAVAKAAMDRISRRIDQLDMMIPSPEADPGFFSNVWAIIGGAITAGVARTPGVPSFRPTGPVVPTLREIVGIPEDAQALAELLAEIAAGEEAGGGGGTP